MSDYIKREEISRTMYEEAMEKDNGEMVRWDSGCWVRYKLFENVLDSIPAAEVEEVRHGHWEFTRAQKRCGYGKCSVCAEMGHISAYCPNCGAKMDEVTE